MPAGPSTRTAGLPELRAAIAAKLNSENDLPYAPEQILVTAGGSRRSTTCWRCCSTPVMRPSFRPPPGSPIRRSSRFSAQPVFVETTEETGLKLTTAQLEMAITPGRACSSSTPHPRTGAVYAPDELAALAEVLVAHQIAVVADEIYEKLVYDGLYHKSIGSLSREVFDLTVTINGFSKAYAATGWRLGYAAAPLPAIEAATAVQDHSTSGANTFAQYGALAGLASPGDTIEDMRVVFEERRNLVVAGLQAIPGLTCSRPGGAFYVFPNISRTGLSSMDFCKRLLEQEAVAAVPGLAFGAEGYIRISYATDTSTLREGLRRLDRFVRSL